MNTLIERLEQKRTLSFYLRIDVLRLIISGSPSVHKEIVDTVVCSINVK